MSQKIIKPEGMELLKYLNRGYAICNECGAVMDLIEGKGDEYDIYACPSCGWKVDTDDYEYEDNDNEILEDYAGDMPPAGCRACGGPYPQCKTSCKLFDD